MHPTILNLCRGLSLAACLCLADGGIASTHSSYILSGQWQSADGLPVDSLYSVVIDEQGRLWTASHDGLSRFDGFEFVHFHIDSEPPLPSNRLSRVHELSGHLILHFEDQQLGVFDEQRFERIAQVSRERLLVKSTGLWFVEDDRVMRWNPESGAQWVGRLPGVTAIAAHPNGNDLMLSTVSGDVVQLSYSDGTLQPIFQLDDAPALGLSSSPDGQLGILGHSSFTAVDLDTRTTAYAVAIPSTQHDTRQIHWTQEGWLLTLDGPPPLGRLVRITPDGIAAIETAPYDFHHFTFSRQDGQGRHWVNHGNQLIRDGQPVYSSDWPIFDFRFDRYGQVWLATLQGGLKQLTVPVMEPACAGRDCMEDPNSYLVTEHADGLLIGSQFALYHHKPEDQSWQRLLIFHPLSSLVDGDELLIGGSGLCRLTSEGHCANGREWAGHVIRMLYRDTTNAVWMGSSQGLFRRDPTGQWNGTALSPAFVRAGVSMDDGRLIFATAQDGVLLVPDPFEPDRIDNLVSTQNGLASNAVRSLHVLPDQRLLVGLEDRGLCLVNPDHGVERCISVADGLPHHSVHRMIEDEYQRLWINTNQGIYQVETAHLLDFLEGRAAQLNTRRFDTRHGMPSSEGNGGLHQAGTRTADGRIWFPNQRGVVVIHPERAQPTRHLLTASITALGHASDQAIRLPAEGRFLRLRLGATALKGAQFVQFRYRLGATAPWNFIGEQTELAFESLAPGNYQLEVQARYSDGQWPEQSTRLDFQVPHRLTERAAFWTSLALVGLLLLASLFWRERTQVARLERTVNRRTAELSKALSTVQAQAADIQRHANRRHQLFLAIGHELRTPLTLILGPLQDRKSPPSTQQLARMRQGSEQMANLIEQILDLEQVEHVRPDDFKPQRLSDLLIRAMETATLLADAKDIDLDAEWQALGRDHWIQADSAHLDRALLILLDNAIKYAPEGGKVQLRIALDPQSERVAIQIEDNGPGIEPAQREEIFEPFVRASAQQTGTGLGLALCRRIVEQHGGSIWVDDSALGGANFVLELPLARGLPDSDSAQALSTGRILVVDDNPGIRAHVTEILADRYELLEAAGAHEAERLARSHAPDIMLIDASMPQVDGLTLIRRLREDEQTAGIALILFTAHGHRDMEVDAFRAGADHYLEKPFTADQLLSRVERVLQQRSLPVKPTASAPDTPSPPVQAASAGTEPGSAFIQHLEHILSSHLNDPELDVDQLAALCGTSRASLYRKLADRRDMTPAEFIREFRLRRAADLLRDSSLTVSEIADQVGFRRLSGFTRAFKAHFHCTPSAYRKSQTEG